MHTFLVGERSLATGYLLCRFMPPSCHDDRIMRIGVPHGMQDDSDTIFDLNGSVRAVHTVGGLVENMLRIFTARAIGGEHYMWYQVLDDGVHLQPLAGVAVAVAAEHSP